MAQDELLYAELVQTNNIAGGVSGGTSGIAVSISGTIASVMRKSKVLPGSAVTSVTVAKGAFDGQDLTIVNVAQVAGSSIAFAAAGSAAGCSNVATDFVISGLTASSFSWDANTALWYPVVN